MFSSPILFRISDVQQVENCFLQVFFSNWKTSSILLVITEALKLLMTIYKDVKIRTADKGYLLIIFCFNVLV